MDLEKILSKSKNSSRTLLDISDDRINKALNKLAVALVKNSAGILKDNKKDLAKISNTDPIYDRILLNPTRILEIADSLKTISKYDSPIGRILEQRTLKNGLKLKKVSVPFGVIGVVFEARPNVVVDVFALCFKSKNACVLKGGSQSEFSNKVLVKIIKDTLKAEKIDENILTLLPNDRELVAKFLKMDKYIDVIIPRGSKGLIDFVRDNSRIPVIETGAGVVHTYIDESAKADMSANIIFNAKTTRPSVCNSLDTMIINKKQLKNLHRICGKLAEKNVIIYADTDSYKGLDGEYPKTLLFKAKKEYFGMEFLSLKMSIKTVNNLQEAIDFITKYSSMHSEAIITENKKNAEYFLNKVDAAAVYVNASTRHTDGGVFELGAEIGISTQKLHARGPMGIKELTGYKWEITGTGQTRESGSCNIIR